MCLYFKHIVFFLLISSIVGFSTNVYSQTEKKKQNATIKVENEEIISLPEKWKYHSGDDTLWASPSFDDSQWDTINTELNLRKLPVDFFTGIGWFRVHLNIPAQWRNKTLGLDIFHIGASEIYVDGKFIYRFGEIDSLEEGYIPRTPIAFQFNDSANHIIAIRYANHNYNVYREKYGNVITGFLASISDLNNSLIGNDIGTKTINFFQLILFAFLITLSIIHLLLFLFYRKQIENIYYAIFVFFLSLVFLFLYIIFNTTTPSVYLSFNHYLQVVWIIFFLSLLKLVYAMFNPSHSKNLFFIATIPAIAIYVFYYFLNFKYGGIIYIVFVLFICIESIRSIITGIIRKQSGAQIIAAGLGIFILSVLSILPVIVIKGSLSFSATEFDTETILILSAFIVAIISIPVSMSVYLAYNSAKTNKNLEQKLVEVETLSIKTIAQEKEKQQILSSQKETLEIQVKERTAEVVKQKEIIEEKNKEITDSITYALRIQKAILPHLNTILAALPQCFVLYKPKDIVAGDFYWMEVIPPSPNEDGLGGEVIFIAAADCTGHGVPGAFTSMICSEKLNDAIKHSNNPGEILSLANKGIKVSLKQGESVESTKDGMDIALCSVDIKNGIVKYAGANRPLWIIRNGQTTVEEIKATKQAIGGHTNDEQVFETHTIQLQSGDTFYISSDGYADQDGGDKGKKLMTKTFKQMLLDIQDKSMKEQKEYLGNFIESWRGERNQLDDILVIGIRI